MKFALSIYLLVLTLAPVVVVLGGWPVWAAVLLVLALLVWRWLITLASISAPPKGPALILDSISASHYVEKVRWCMDRLGLDYVENPSGGTLGAFFTGRTVPRLRFHTGLVESSIGNSAEILRYLWGRYEPSLGARAEFLRADPQRLELEQQIDRVGRDLQVWVYWHILPHRQLTLHAWGIDTPTVPVFHKLCLRLLYPLLRKLIRRAFGINPLRYRKAIEHVDHLLDQSEQALSEHEQSILGSTTPNYTDFSFAAINGLWLQPRQYGGGKADFVRLDRDQRPDAMNADIDRWTSRYPLSVAFIRRLYTDEREHSPGLSTN